MYISGEWLKNNEENIREIMRICDDMKSEVTIEELNAIKAHCRAALRGTPINK
jgi:hypothetical protein